MFNAGDVSPEAKKLCETSSEALQRAISICRPGVPYKEIGKVGLGGLWEMSIFAWPPWPPCCVQRAIRACRPQGVPCMKCDCTLDTAKESCAGLHTGGMAVVHGFLHTGSMAVVHCFCGEEAVS